VLTGTIKRLGDTKALGIMWLESTHSEW